MSQEDYYTKEKKKIADYANGDPVLEMALILTLGCEEHQRDCQLTHLVVMEKLEIALKVAKTDAVFRIGVGSRDDGGECDYHSNIHTLLEAALRRKNKKGVGMFAPLLKDWLSRTTIKEAYGYEADFLTEWRKKQWENIANAEALLAEEKKEGGDVVVKQE